jgi:primosomal protein N' (replication factor Y)
MNSLTLFQDDTHPPTDAPRATGPFAAVALEQAIDRMLDYSIPPALVGSLQVGQRVRVPLGRNNKPAHGYVVDLHPETNYPKIKPILSIDDARVLITPPIMRLAQWISRYYVAPLGSVLEAVLPSAVRKKIGLGYSQMVRLAQEREAIQTTIEKTRAPKRRAILARLLQLEPGEAIDLVRLAGQAGATPVTIRKLVRLGLITITPEVDLSTLSIARNDADASESPKVLNADQQKAFEAIAPRVREGGFSINLLFGVTGSGKTEVYLQCIQEAVKAGKNAIVLVPEIALTPQTVRRFAARFKNVAVLHSGLSATARHRFWQQVLLGHAQVVVGARSAIFAPMPNIGVIVVDEEHDPSYKADQIPRYHGRDVAIKRAQLENVPVILGSATPSLETWVRVQPLAGSASDPGAPGIRQGDDTLPLSPPSLALPANQSQPSRTLPPLLATLPRRVGNAALAKVDLIDMRAENRARSGIHLLSRRLEGLLRNTIDSNHQAILLLNRRGYSNFVYCPSCDHVVSCDYCDTTMTYHRSSGEHVLSAKVEAGIHTGQLHCHYCLAVRPLPDHCPECGKKLNLFGLGTQRVEEELAKKFPDLRYARVDSDAMRSGADYEKLLGKFGRGELQVLLGTQMIAKGLDYPNVTLVGVISGDTALALPDFRASERTFALITQVAGRAGRGTSAGRVVLQTFLPDDPSIRLALQQDYPAFAERELALRREVGLPPITRMVRIVMRDQDSTKLIQLAEELAAELTAAIDAGAEGGLAVQMKGPMPCAIGRIAGYHRYQITLTAASPGTLQKLLAAVRQKGTLSRNERIAVDVDPVSLL